MTYIDVCQLSPSFDALDLTLFGRNVPEIEFVPMNVDSSLKFESHGKCRRGPRDDLIDFIRRNVLLAHERLVCRPIVTKELVHDENVEQPRCPPPHHEDDENHHRPVGQANLAAMQDAMKAVTISQNQKVRLVDIVNRVHRP